MVFIVCSSQMRDGNPSTQQPLARAQEPLPESQKAVDGTPMMKGSTYTRSISLPLWGTDKLERRTGHSVWDAGRTRALIEELLLASAI